MPISFILFALTGVVFLVQLLPVPGIFLMMMAAMVWPIVTLNGAFLAVFIDVGRGKLRRAWLVLPALWFGGYAVATIGSHMEMQRLDQWVADTNAGQIIPFDDTLPVAIEFEGHSSEGLAKDLVSSYRLPVVYETIPGPWGASRVSWRLGGIDVCQRVQTDPKLRQAGFYARTIYENRERVSGLCVYKSPEDSPHPRITVAISNEEMHASLASYALRRITITDASGKTIKLIAGYASALNWLPMPFMGCVLNDMSASWDCTAGFVHERRRALGADRQFSLIPVIAKGLGLKQSPATERRDEISARPAPPFKEIVVRQATRELADLDKSMAAERVQISQSQIDALAQHPEMLASRADMMVDTLARSVARGRSANNLQRVIALLPPADFLRIGPRLLQIFDTPADRKYYRLEMALLIRLGETGGAALPSLVRYTKAPNEYIAAGALLGICRIGRPAAAAAADIADVALGQDKQVEYQAAYAALQRIGRPDLAKRVRVRAPFNQSEHFARWDNVTPESPADVCVMPR